MSDNTKIVWQAALGKNATIRTFRTRELALEYMLDRMKQILNNPSYYKKDKCGSSYFDLEYEFQFSELHIYDSIPDTKDEDNESSDSESD